MFHSLLFFVLLLKADISILTNAAACNDPPLIPVVMKGSSPAQKCRFPYLVSLRHHRWGTHTCSGTLIKSRYILTSASCASLVGKGIANINGFYRKGPFEEAISIETFTKHPNFVLGRIANDVAIVKLAQPSSQQTVRLPSSSGTPSKGRSVILIGWGRKLPQGPFSDIMQMNKDLEISPSDCRSRTIENGVICAGKPQSNLCEGDMGGPLVRNGGSGDKDIQVGITSKVVGDCGTLRGPGLFTEVASVVSWIKQNT